MDTSYAACIYAIGLIILGIGFVIFGLNYISYVSTGYQDNTFKDISGWFMLIGGIMVVVGFILAPRTILNSYQ